MLKVINDQRAAIIQTLLTDHRFLITDYFSWARLAEIATFKGSVQHLVSAL
jgi:hypothetical protein